MTSAGTLPGLLPITLIVLCGTTVTQAQLTVTPGSLSFSIQGGGNLTVSPTSLSFSYQPNSSLPPPQSVTVVNSTGSSVVYNVSCAASSGLNWITCPRPNNTTPSGVVVSVNPVGLSAGTYSATLSVSPLTGTTPPTQIPVTLTVFSAANLLVSLSAVTFDYISGGATPTAQYLSVTSTGGPIAFNSVVNGPSWITLSPLQARTPAEIAISVNPPSGAAPGNYDATVVLTPPVGNAVTASILVRITSADDISSSQSSVSFDYTIAEPSSSPSDVSSTSSGDPLGFDAVAATSGCSPWLDCTQSTQYTPATVAVIPPVQGLAAEVYSGHISIVPDEAKNSSATIDEAPTVTSSPTFTSSLWGIAFSYQIGQTSTPLQATVIGSSTGSPLSFSVSATTSSGGAWLLTAGEGTTPATVAATINPAAVTPGTYAGTIMIQPNDSSLLPLEIPVILNVSAGPVFLPIPNQLSFQYETDGSVRNAHSLTIGTTGGPPIVFEAATRTMDGGQWLTVSPANAYAPTELSVTVDPQGVTAGMYYGIVIVTDPSGNTPPSYIPVSFQVANEPILSVSSEVVTFSAASGGLPSSAQQIAVGSSGPPTQFHVDTYGGSWLQVAPTDALTTSAVSVWAVPDRLAPGYYFGAVSISIPGVPGSQEMVPIVFLVVSSL